MFLFILQNNLNLQSGKRASLRISLSSSRALSNTEMISENVTCSKKYKIYFILKVYIRTQRKAEVWNYKHENPCFSS